MSRKVSCLFIFALLIVLQFWIAAEENTAKAVDGAEVKKAVPEDDGAIDVSKTVKITVKSSGDEPISHRVSSEEANFTFNLNAKTVGVFLLSDFNFNLKTQPKGLTLSMGGDAPLISPAYNAEEGKLKVMLNRNSPLSNTGIDLPKKGNIIRFAMRQRDQMGLYALSGDRKDLMLVYLATFDYVLEFPEFSRYKLCKDLVYKSGDKILKKEDVEKGIGIGCLDELELITVKGTDPLGKKFSHSYRLNNDLIEERVDEAFKGMFKYFSGGK
jgi:hypothetical protein